VIQRSREFPGLQPRLQERRHILSQSGWLTADELGAWDPEKGLDTIQADHMIENAIGVHALPLGLGLNFRINGRDVLVPMAVEEPSVVAGASFMAKLARAGGGFTARTTAPEMIGQVQILDVVDLQAARQAILGHKEDLLAEADATDPVLQRLGGGARDLEVRIIEDSPLGPFLVVHLIFDVRDAMGANAVNTAVERLSGSLEVISGGRAHLRILSNLADRRLAECAQSRWMNWHLGLPSRAGAMGSLRPGPLRQPIPTGRLPQ
jgi:hydroxymethylglutaryl-CoA reductase